MRISHTSWFGGSHAIDCYLMGTHVRLRHQRHQRLRGTSGATPLHTTQRETIENQQTVCTLARLQVSTDTVFMNALRRLLPATLCRAPPIWTRHVTSVTVHRVKGGGAKAPGGGTDKEVELSALQRYFDPPLGQPRQQPLRRSFAKASFGHVRIRGLRRGP